MGKFWNWLTLQETSGQDFPEVEQRDMSYSIGDPALAEWLGLSGSTLAGVSVTENTSLGLTAVYRSVSLISGTVATLPLKTYRKASDDTRQEVPSWMDSPGAVVGMTTHDWVELMLTHLLLHGNYYALKAYAGSGALAGLAPIHPRAVSVEVDENTGAKSFRVTLANGQSRQYSAADILHIPALGTDGLVGLSPIQVARQSIGTSIAGDQAAARMFGNGLTVGALVTSDEALNREDAETVLAGLKARTTGVKNAGDVAFVNASLKVQQLTMTADDAQFLQSRQFGVDEIARLFGVPKVLLAQDGASTWGSGIAELLRGFQKFTLMPWTSKIEAHLSALLPKPQFVSFNYKGLLEGTPQEEVELLIRQVESGLLSVDEARKIMDRPPLTTSTSSDVEVEDPSE